MINARALGRVIAIVVSIGATAGCNAIFGLEEAELGDPFGSDASAGSSGAAGAGGAAGSNLGGAAGNAGESQGGAAGQAGQGQGGTAGQAGAGQGGAAGQAGENQGGAAGQAGENQGGAAGQAGENQGGASGEGGAAGAGGSPAECNDGQKNGSETDKDCGGQCPPCDLDKACEQNADCKSIYCNSNHACATPSCMDSVMNGTETGKDCGGICTKCADGQGCKTGTDCTSGVCKNLVCAAPECGDGVKNGTESCDMGPSNGTYNSSCSSTCDGPGPYCGDGIRQQPQEECDGSVGAFTCQQLTPGTPAGVPTCDASCKVQTTTCTACDTASLTTDWGFQQGQSGLWYSCAGNGSLLQMQHDAFGDRWYSGLCSIKRVRSDHVITRTGQEEALFEAEPAAPGSGNPPYSPAVTWKALAALPVAVDVVARREGGCGDGVTISIWKNGVSVHSEPLPDAFGRISFEVTPVGVGDEIQVQFDPNTNNDCDKLWIKSLTFAQQTGNACAQCGSGAMLPGKRCLSTIPAHTIDFTFKPHTARVTDINGDRIPDLLVSGTDTVAALKGQGDGSFVLQQYSSAACAMSTDLELVTLDTATGADLVTACEGGFVGGMSAGSFTYTFGGGVTPMAGARFVEVGAINSDAHPDLIVGRLEANPIQHCPGAAGGLFGSCSTVATPAGWTSLANMLLADVNNDSHLDLLASPTEHGGIYVFRGNATGGFNASTMYASGMTLALATDLNQDNLADAVGIINVSTPQTFQVFTAQADGTYKSSGDFNATLAGTSATAAKADLDVDGRPDLLFATGTQTGAPKVQAWFGEVPQQGMYAGNNWTGDVPISTASRSYSVTSADLNGDGAPDVVATIYDASKIVIYLGNP